ncbi:hypothetical protein BN873_100019 [Candidatus Competibacter denitrificans Run_A_D11]|uniref:Uncharacterized protein n=1 Tax=Candidatus Competibacter denitrificans Run_A_D11 TaxID=1400863 RepID=W6M0T5_9GAMM|nr:hypothetical protein BN873_100019 [Candidatus Competibacter denitrificans Run_A_D11]
METAGFSSAALPATGNGLLGEQPPSNATTYNTHTMLIGFDICETSYGFKFMRYKRHRHQNGVNQCAISLPFTLP